jgi:cyclophilin family peptidyl-prolyl cis-trans isomerase
LLILFSLTIACYPTPQPFEYEIQVRATDTGASIANAQVRAEIGVRDVYQGASDANGNAHLTIDARHRDRWAKIVIEADDYKRHSILVKLVEDNPSATVGLESLTAATPQPATPLGLSTVPQLDAATPLSPANSLSQSETTSTRPLAGLSPGARTGYYTARPELTIDPNKTYHATIQTSKGDIKLLLDAQAAPEHVNNFIFLSNEGFYDGLTFHRVEPGFVIQGGDPLGDGTGGPGYTIPGEFSLKHIEGALAMARQPDEVNPNRESSGSQFYITLAPTDFLDGQYSVFGHVEEGMDVVRSIQIGDMIEQITIEVE